MKKTFIVGVREMHVRHFRVEAENEDEAKELVNELAPEVTDLEYEEYSHQMDRDTWSVEESTEDVKPVS